MGMALRHCGCRTIMPAEAPSALSLFLAFSNRKIKSKQFEVQISFVEELSTCMALRAWRRLASRGAQLEGDGSPAAAGPIAAGPVAAGAQRWRPDNSRCGNGGSPEMGPRQQQGGIGEDDGWMSRGRPRTAVVCGSRGRRLGLEMELGGKGWSARTGGCRGGARGRGNASSDTTA